MGHVHLQATGEVNPVVTNKSKTHGNNHMLHTEALQLELVRVYTITYNVNKTTGYSIKVSPATVEVTDHSSYHIFLTISKKCYKFMSGLQLVSLVLW